jgi:hypothetical protein
MLPEAGPVLVMHTPRLEVERAQASAILPAPALAARHHEAQLAASKHRVEDGHVVDGDHPEGGLHVAMLENSATTAPT